MFRQTESESHMGSFEKVGCPGQLSSNIWGVGARYELLRLLQVLSGLTTSGLESQETSLQRSLGFPEVHKSYAPWILTTYWKYSQE